MTDHLFALRLTVSAMAVVAVPQVAMAQTVENPVEEDTAGPEPMIDDDRAPIVVTAQRREERQVDVPITITSLDADTLVTANVSQLTDIGKVTPGLRFDRQTQFVQPTIRGIGTAVTNSGSGANVGIYIDGFYSPNPIAAELQLLNVESIQVLKGPQGTLFGRNTTGGAILVDSADPSDVPEGIFKISYGRFNEINLQGYLTGPLSDGISIDLEGRYNRGDGFQTDIITGDDEVGAFENWSVRTGIRFEFSPDVSLLVRYQHGSTDDPRALLTNAFSGPDLESGAPFFAPPGTFTSDPDLVALDPGIPPFFVGNTDIVQATLEANLGFADLTSYTQYRTEDTDSRLNLDHSALTLFSFGLPVFNDTFSQEFLLTSKPGSRLQWTAGLFYFQNRDTYETYVDNNVPTVGRVRLGGSSTLSRSFAAFADATYQFSDSFFLTLGGRIAHDQIDDAYYIPQFSGVRVPVTDAQYDVVETDKFTPRVVLRYKPTENSSIYGSYAKGYKAGILDVGGATGNPVRPENVDAFEIGYKSNGPAFGFETAAFYYDYRDLQVSLFSGSPPAATLVNAASSEIYGVEGSVRWNPTRRLNLNIGATYVHARYKRFVNAPIYTPCVTQDAATQAACAAQGISFLTIPGTTLTDVTMQRAPEFTGNAGARYSADLFGGTLDLSGNLYYTSEFFFGPSGIQFEGGNYEVLSLRAQWNAPGDQWYLAVFGDNVTDNRYVNQAQYNNFAIGATWSEPASWGVEFGVNF